MNLSQSVINNLSRSSLIRAMFEEGEKLHKKYGADNVYDFSLGNPDIEPPKPLKDALKMLVEEDQPKLHGYMTNAGYPEVRACVAGALKRDTGVDIRPENIIMTVGASGALNVIFKTILNPGEEVITFSPIFVDYRFYIENHGGVVVVIPPNFPSFEPDPEVLYSYITPKTKAVLINSPNNPTGVVYSEEVLRNMAKVIEKREKEFGTTIFVVSDEPYRTIVFDGVKVPPILSMFKNSLIGYSFSKAHSVPGERIGYVAANPGIKDIDLLMNGLIFSHRVLGFINAPSMFQKVIPHTIDATVAVDEYRTRRDMMYDILVKCGFTCNKGSGAFYLFPKSPIEDDREFCRKAMEYRLVFTPGVGFECPGYFRIAYCVDRRIIEKSAASFEALAKYYNLI
jgi:aspartate aminotransferase